MCKTFQKLPSSSVNRQLKKNGLPLLSEINRPEKKKGNKKPIVSTEIGSVSKFTGERVAVKLVAKAGFDAWDFSMFSNMVLYDGRKKKVLPNSHPLAGNNYLAFARELKRIGEDNGIFCNQSHAPFPSVVPEIRSYLKRAIECTAEAGGKTCVIHPCNDWGTEQNAEMFWELLPFAKSCGVKIATENMWNWDSKNGHAAPASCSDPKSFLDLLNAVNDDYFVACLDIGHAEMKGLGTSAAEMIYALNNKLGALHIHDNDKLHDSHQIPYSMSIDYPPIIKALKDIGYSGEFTLESDAYIKKRSLVKNLVEMQGVARRMANEFALLSR
ncbi:MAG: sugar phosphate isomerase/epimerase [Clostridia bacterium]|nr:sugar phosphate isomerase/epimerase [Clostridia bacterium]